MASIQLASATASALADAITTLVDGGSGAGTIKVYTGTLPTDLSTAGKTLLATFTLVDPAAAAASAGVATWDFSPQIDATVAATGTAGWFLLGGTELTSTGGYARPVVTNNGTNWPGASAGATTSATVTFATSTAAWSDTATHWVLYDDADGTTAWDAGVLNTEISVDAAGAVVETTVTIYYNGGL